MKPNQIDEREARHTMPVAVYLLAAFVVAVALASCLLAVL
jgi:hypothetical protein